MTYEDDLNKGDKVVCISNIGEGTNLPLKLHKTYTYDGVYNHNGGFIQLQEKECRWHGYDIDRFVTLKEYRKLKLQKLNEFQFEL